MKKLQSQAIADIIPTKLCGNNSRILILLFTCNFFYLFQGHAQILNFDQYYLHSNKATKFYYESNFDSAVFEFKKSFSSTSYVHDKYIVRAKKSAKKSKNKVMLHILDSIKKSRSPLNTDYAQKINTLFKFDQGIRGKSRLKLINEYRKCINDGGCDSLRLSYLKQNNRISGIEDSTNGQHLVALINQYGFPSERLVGGESYANAIIILVHFDSDTENLILGSILEKALKSGDILPNDYAWIIDRRSGNKNGTYVYYTLPIGVDKLKPDEIDSVDLKRQAIGLPKLKDSQIIVYRKNYMQVKYLD